MPEHRGKPENVAKQKKGELSAATAKSEDFQGECSMNAARIWRKLQDRSEMMKFDLI